MPGILTDGKEWFIVIHNRFGQWRLRRALRQDAIMWDGIRAGLTKLRDQLLQETRTMEDKTRELAKQLPTRAQNRPIADPPRQQAPKPPTSDSAYHHVPDEGEVVGFGLLAWLVAFGLAVAVGTIITDATGIPFKPIVLAGFFISIAAGTCAAHLHRDGDGAIVRARANPKALGLKHMDVAELRATNQILADDVDALRHETEAARDRWMSAEGRLHDMKCRVAEHRRQEQERAEQVAAREASRRITRLLDGDDDASDSRDASFALRVSKRLKTDSRRRELEAFDESLKHG